MKLKKYRVFLQKKDTVNIALREFILHHRQEEIIDMFGSVEYEKEYDYKKIRTKHRTRTNIIEKAVGAYFDTLDEAISDKRIDEVNKGNAEVFTLDQVAKSLGLKRGLLK